MSACGGGDSFFVPLKFGRSPDKIFVVASLVGTCSTRGDKFEGLVVASLFGVCTLTEDALLVIASLVDVCSSRGDKIEGLAATSLVGKCSSRRDCFERLISILLVGVRPVDMTSIGA